MIQRLIFLSFAPEKIQLLIFSNDVTIISNIYIEIYHCVQNSSSVFTVRSIKKFDSFDLVDCLTICIEQLRFMMGVSCQRRLIRDIPVRV